VAVANTLSIHLNTLSFPAKPKRFLHTMRKKPRPTHEKTPRGFARSRLPAPSFSLRCAPHKPPPRTPIRLPVPALEHADTTPALSNSLPRSRRRCPPITCLEPAGVAILPSQHRGRRLPVRRNHAEIHGWLIAEQLHNQAERLRPLPASNPRDAGEGGAAAGTPVSHGDFSLPGRSQG
jgi:hypothetical protein